MEYIGRKRLLNITARGDSAFIRYSAHADGMNFTETWSEGQNYIGFATGQKAPTTPEGYVWSEFVGKDGQDGKDSKQGDSVFIRYSTDDDPYGAEITPYWLEGMNYIGFATGQTAPTEKMDYTWCKFVGGSGGETSEGYTVKFAVTDTYCKGLRVSTTAPTHSGDYELEIYNEALTEETLTGELSNVTKLYLWTDSLGGVGITVSKNGTILIQGNCDDNASFDNVMSNVIKITEDCTLTVTIDY